MGIERHIRLFRNGRNRAVRIPRDLDFFVGEDAVIRREGDRLVIEAKPREPLIDLLDRLEPLEEPWPEVDDPPPEPVDF